MWFLLFLNKHRSTTFWHELLKDVHLHVNLAWLQHSRMHAEEPEHLCCLVHMVPSIGVLRNWMIWMCKSAFLYEIIYAMGFSEMRSYVVCIPKAHRRLFYGIVSNFQTTPWAIGTLCTRFPSISYCIWYILHGWHLIMNNYEKGNSWILNVLLMMETKVLKTCRISILPSSGTWDCSAACLSTGLLKLGFLMNSCPWSLLSA